jgi:RNA polymerase sigma factor (sigma-70 family)
VASPWLPARLLRLAGDPRLVEQARGGSIAAFEVLYDRHHRGVLSFCHHMLASREEAEDAVQHTFIAAHRELVGTRKPIQLRPWLYAIARNRCLTMLRARRERPSDTIAERATEPLAAEFQRREDLRELLRDVGRLPEQQRGALVLAELGDVPHDEIAAVLDCPPQKVKALVFQARSSLSASRDAREASCQDVRRLLATLGGGSLRRNVLRRHLRECGGCRDFRRRLRALRTVLPVAPGAGLKEAVMASALGGSGPAAVLGGGAVCAGGTGVLAAKALVAVTVASGGATAAVVPERRVVAPPPPEAAQPQPAAIAAAAPPQRVRAPEPPAVAPPRAPAPVEVVRRPPRKPASAEVKAPERPPAAPPVAHEPPPAPPVAGAAPQPAAPEPAQPTPEPAPPPQPEPTATPPAELPPQPAPPEPVAEIEEPAATAEPAPTEEPAPAEEPAPEAPDRVVEGRRS